MVLGPHRRAAHPTELERWRAAAATAQRIGLVPGQRSWRRRLTDTAYPAKAGWGQGVSGRMPTASEAATQEATYRR
eukprot:10480306-Alexandrium_andersonii.AAC.1